MGRGEGTDQIFDFGGADGEHFALRDFRQSVARAVDDQLVDDLFTLFKLREKHSVRAMQANNRPCGSILQVSVQEGEGTHIIEC